MKADGIQALWTELRAAALVSGDQAPAARDASPWFVRTMLGAAGWMGAAFLMAFVGGTLSVVMRSAPAVMVLGLVCIGAATALFRTKRDNDFASQFGLALGIAGQGFLLFGLADGLGLRGDTVAWTMAVIQAVLFTLIPSFIHRVWTSGTGAGAVVYALSDGPLQFCVPGLLAAACAWVWLNELRLAQYGSLIRAGGYGLTLALVGAVTVVAWWNDLALFWRTGTDAPGGLWPFAGAALGGAVLVWAARTLLARNLVDVRSPAGRWWLGFAGIVAVASIGAPGLAPAVLVLVLGFANGNRVLTGLGVAGLVSYLAFYYYWLDIILLHKSMLMVATGTALLAARVLSQRVTGAAGSDEASRA